MNNFDSSKFKQRLRKYEGEFFTPKIITSFISSILDVKQRAKILDPTCGGAGFLLEIAKKNPKKDISLLGVEINKEVYNYAKKRLEDEGIKAKLILGDSTLYIDGVDNEQFDIIVADFPAGKKIYDRHVLNQYEFGRNKASVDISVILLEKCSRLLSPNGEMAIILPQGFLFPQKYRAIRKFLAQNLILKSIISLPHGVYFPYIGIKFSIILLGKSEKPAEFVYFANAENADEKKNDLIEISKEINAFRKGNVQFANGFTSSYKEISNGQRWDVRLHDPRFAIIEEIAQKNNYEIKNLAAISTLLTGERQKDIYKYVVLGGDILFADKGTIGRPVLITKEKKIYESKTHYIIIRPDKLLIEPFYLFSYLKSKYGIIQIDKFKLGATIPYLTKELLASFQILIPPLKQQKKIGKDYLNLEQTLSEIESTVSQIRSSTEDIFSLNEALKLSKRLSRTDSEDLLSTLPYPIAIGYRKFKHERLSSRRVSRLLDIFEIILKYITIIQISRLAKHGKSEELKKIFKKNRFLGAPTDGSWLSILKESSDLAKANDSIPFELNIDLDNSDLLNLLDQLLNLRNEIKHGATISEEYAKELLIIHEPKLSTLMKFISPLSSFRLRKINNSWKRRDGYEYEIFELMGDNPEFETNNIKIKSDLYADFVYLFHSHLNEIIPLTPFLVFEICPLCRNKELFFYDRMVAEGPKYVGYRNSHRAVFSSYDDFLQEYFP